MSVTIYGSGQIVKQVVQGTVSSTSGTSTSSSSFVTTGLSASITPTSASNKVLVTVDGNAYQGTSGANTWFTVYRNGTNLNSGASPATLCGMYIVAASVVPVNIIYLDSPATTSACTYTVYFSVGSGTCQYPFNPSNSGSTIATITLQEISGT